jgi:hypothetical protein
MDHSSSITPHAADQTRQIFDKARETIVKSQNIARKCRNQQLISENLSRFRSKGYPPRLNDALCLMA